MTERRQRFGERALVDFFQQNPTEELTADDAAAKIGCSAGSARNYLASLSGEGILERVSVYRLRREVLQPAKEPAQ